MNWRADCAIVIPCLNEAERIQPLIREILTYLPTIILVDDGSTDASPPLAAEAGAIVLRQTGNLGKGAALQRGFMESKKRGFTWALTIDGDGQHAPRDIPSFLREAEQGAPALIIGNRMGNQGMPALRRWVNRWMSSRLSRLCGVELPDTQCGFRLVSLEAWSGLSCGASHYEFESELLIEMLAARLEVRFVPVETIYRAEKSRIHPWHDTVRWIRWWRAVDTGRFCALATVPRPEAAPEIKAPLSDPRLT